MRSALWSESSYCFPFFKHQKVDKITQIILALAHCEPDNVILPQIDKLGAAAGAIVRVLDPDLMRSGQQLEVTRSFCILYLDVVHKNLRCNTRTVVGFASADTESVFFVLQSENSAGFCAGHRHHIGQPAHIGDDSDLMIS